MSKGYGTNSGPQPGRGRPDAGRGLANYMPYASDGGRRRRQGVLDLAQSAGGARLVAVGDFTSVGTTGSLHGVAIFG